ncbi:MAG TPA: SDR family NAD(P)-dependent oxidoreductase [Alphaproteobacteria bacterium]|nr:SDR family NAD(P)-dependent oxidoreductase [Alphaproteobacteria bacterium]MDP7428130.1 SDR family NAD(P)-dependent oxidoreductase [Alphaproteobacteria bacterium]HJM51631.1 SDR family NAD(P)-dependent oxidoreductase [Alphaproteobacteria bacterium]
MNRLEGKRILVSGAGSGIGRAAAFLFAREGASVALAEINAEAGQAAAAAIEAAGGRALFVETDVADEASFGAALAATVAAFGGLDVLYNNAGGATARDGRISEIALDEFWRTIGVDLFGTFLGCRLAIPYLEAAGGGSIINTTSIRALTATQGADAYTAAKGGVLTLTKALAQELAPQGIRVNAIAPGVVGTERVLAMISDDNPIVQKSLLGICAPEDVAWMALYLASDESRRVTGAILPVDSGASAV